MCAHPDHEVVTLPDGQVDETHVFTADDISAITERTIDRLLYGHLFTSTAGDD